MKEKATYAVELVKDVAPKENQSRDNNLTSLARAQVFFRQEPSLASSVSHEDPALLGRLDVRLVVASNTITNSNKTKLFLFEDVSMLRGEFQ